MICPKCSHERTLAIRTVTVGAARVNERECEACKHRFVTVAQVVDETSAYRTAKKIQDNGGKYPFRITSNKIG